MTEIIAQITKFFKAEVTQYLVKFFWGILAVSLLILAFVLGRVTKFMENSPVFTFESKEQEEIYYEKEKNSLFDKKTTSNIVASKSGKRYYFVWCSGAANIKESNKRYFATEELAQQAGYTLANNCK